MRKIAIIGAGASGLTAAVKAVQENMLPTIFEHYNRVGGVWGPDDDRSPQGLAWPNMQTNISRHTGLFSNYSWPADTADFPTTQEVYNYIDSYADHFDIKKYINFNTTVTAVLPQADQWLVCFKQHDGLEQEERFDRVIIASSKFNNPYIPVFQGLEKIAHKMLHSAHYKSAHDFSAKTV